ncbi:MAG: IPT/TIG domain-containing protein, partial [Thermoguttaceae bacterium]
GLSVSVSGNTVVAGASLATVDGNFAQGAAYVFTEPGSGWANMTQTAKLTASDGARDADFGWSVSNSGNTVVVGAYGANGPFNVVTSAGAAYVFTKPGAGWAKNMTQAAKLTAADGAELDFFGWSVSISGNTVVVGAVGANRAQGAAYVFAPPAVAGPVVTGISPSHGLTAGGTTVTITGANLAKATKVFFGAKPAKIKSDTNTQIVAISPAGTAGTADVTVVTAEGTSTTSAADQFTYLAAPTVTKISAAGGPLSGGTLVTITGTNLAGATAVMFGKVEAFAFRSTPTGQIVAVSPPGRAGTVNVTVTTAGGASHTSAADKFTYAAAPIIKKIKPVSGPEAGGTRVTITGMNLLNATVYFGGVAATNVSDTANTIVVKNPPNSSAGPVYVTVTTPSGASAPSALYQFTYVAPTKTPGTINSGRIAYDASDLALLALVGRSSPSATIQRKTVDNLMASLLM